ncbi:lipoprotein, putative [Geotalea daltonii FRC-32]|uniref:Lipoprotein, putative n=1 Tax=Geotalea daltonii (strain DSM 22248 / JCM 15807 / FRC-32) TaxID=316067 RepID=B9LZ37_GEODF|nr:hypothetical protein [Geotalea daltonii]ACM18769.1 lipoprotein, putative [Geotalea daltonii FRC-32]
MGNTSATVKASYLLLLIAMLLLFGCASGPRVTMSPAFNPAPEDNIVYLVPFSQSLVPNDFSDTVFNEFVDNLNKNRSRTDVQWYYILKEDLKDIDPAWLTRQVYISGELWGYVENAGCCSTELRAKARLNLFEMEQRDATLEMQFPVEAFFEHDRSTLSNERQRMAKRLATEMADAITDIFARRKSHQSH